MNSTNNRQHIMASYARGPTTSPQTPSSDSCNSNTTTSRSTTEYSAPSHSRRSSASDCYRACHSDGADKIYNSTAAAHSNSKNSNSKTSKSNWLRNVKNWIAVSEPSAQAIKSQRRETFKKHGVHRNDPDAAAKMHLPIGVLPRGTTTSTSGPTPEKKLARELKQRPKLETYTCSQSVSSGYSSGAGSTSGRRNSIAPWT